MKSPENSPRARGPGAGIGWQRGQRLFVPELQTGRAASLPFPSLLCDSAAPDRASICPCVHKTFSACVTTGQLPPFPPPPPPARGRRPELLNVASPRRWAALPHRMSDHN